MKHTLLALVSACAILSAPLSFANAATASTAERSLLCYAVDDAMAALAVDAALNLEDCLKAAEITSEATTSGTIKLSSLLIFDTYARPNFSLDCTLEYTGAPVEANIVGGLTNGVVCR